VTLQVLQNLGPLALARQSLCLPLVAVQLLVLVLVLVPQLAQPACNLSQSVSERWRQKRKPSSV
jgi:hypothetical protein